MGLENLTECLAGTNPRILDTDNNGVSDDLEDSDSDTLDNALEQVLTSSPGLLDSDDDGVLDAVEVSQLTHPAYSLHPEVPRAVWVDGSIDPITLPKDPRFALANDWTLEGWVRPDVDHAGAFAPHQS